MKSSSQELYEAVMELTRYDDGQSYGNLAVVSEFSKRISDSFNDVNSMPFLWMRSITIFT